jgi:predicted nucleotidyltransferase
MGAQPARLPRSGFLPGPAPVPQGVVAIYLFGSVARGTARASRDVDVGVLYEVTPPATLEGLGFDLAAKLEPAIGRTVDLVVLNRAPADLIHRVLRDGILVVETDRRRRIEFEVRARNQYFDLAPIRAGAARDLVRELRELANPAALASDVRERRFVEHTLQIAIQAMLDVASHIVSDERLGDPETNRELFERPWAARARATASRILRSHGEGSRGGHRGTARLSQATITGVSSSSQPTNSAVGTIAQSPRLLSSARPFE